MRSMLDGLSIRRATLADLPDLLPLAEGLVRQHIAFDSTRYQAPADVAAAYTELFSEHIVSATSIVAIARRDEAPVGYVLGGIEGPSLVALTGRTGWIHDLYVLPAARGLGLGGKLLDTAIDVLRALGCPGGVMLGVAAQNDSAAALFLRRGFRPSLREMTLGP